MIAGTPIAVTVHHLRRGALGVGLVTAVAGAVGGWFWPAVFFPAYLTGFLFVLELALGCLALLLIDHLVGGGWSAAIRRAMEAGVAVFPWVGALFVPVLLGARVLYPWARPGAEADAIYVHAAPYFNWPFFALRAALFVAAWIVVSTYVLRWGRALEAAPTPANRDRLMSLSAGGLVAFGLVGSFAMIDWAMAIEAHWTSTIYPLMLLTGGMLAAAAFGILVTAALARRGPIPRAVPTQAWHDLGNILLTLLMTWAYLAFSQYLIVWAADRAGENIWYLHRGTGGWGIVGLALIGLHFFLPFFVLLSRQAKRQPRVLAGVAASVLALHAVEVAWLVWPSYPGPGWALVWLAIAGAALPVAVALWAYLGKLAAWPVTPPPHASFGEVSAHG